VAELQSLQLRCFGFIAIPPSKKVQLTLLESPLCAFQRAQDEHCMFRKPPKWGLKNTRCPKFEQ